jgi:class 3 adenylate cyclase/PAS domain-containing protein
VSAANRGSQLLRAALDTLDFGVGVFDRHLKLVASNKAFRTLRGYPASLVKPGAELVDLFRHNARRGDYGEGDVEAIAMARLELMRQPFSREHTSPDGRVLFVQATPIVHEGLVLAYTDITARKEAERLVARREQELHVALDNMAGALAYTDADGTIVLRNNRFADMYPVPKELLDPGRPYPGFLRYLAEHGYYGPGDVDAMVARRVESLRNPSGETFEDRTPDGRVYRIVRRRAEGGGAVTVITDVTDFKRSEEMLARKEAVLHAALDNMPGVIVYTDANLDIVICNPRFGEWYPIPAELREPGKPYPALLRHLAENGYYGDGDVDTHVAGRIASLRNPSDVAFEDHAPDGRVYRIARRRAADGGTVTVMSDITELKASEDALREAIARAEAATREAADKAQMLESLSRKLSKYLSPQIYRSIFSGERSADVVSQRKKLTIFFSDIAGFTETTDMLESEELTNLLNQYLREMSAIALEHGATIDKFIGDAIMLFFGDPETRGAREDAIACVRMAIAMQQRMRDLQAEWRERGQEHVFQLRIGINTGFCTVGNFGSADRIDYTIIGNEVNLAARLQQHADLGGILLAHETYALVKDDVATEETGTITVKGFAKPVHTHRVVGVLDAGSEGRVIRKEQEGLLLILDQRKLVGDSREEARRMLIEAAERLK